MSTSQEDVNALIRTAVIKTLEVAARAGGTVESELIRAGTSLANVLAPQTYGQRLHGENNAISLAIRYCCEILMWLDIAGIDDGVAEVKDALAALTTTRIK